jgi:hypothetical protein
MKVRGKLTKDEKQGEEMMFNQPLRKCLKESGKKERK